MSMVAEPIGVALQDEREQLFAVMAHSLLSSVAALGGGLELLAEATLDGERRDRLFALVRRQTDHLDVLLRDLIRTGNPEFSSS